jgi:hypothetical protein
MLFQNLKIVSYENKLNTNKTLIDVYMIFKYGLITFR